MTVCSWAVGRICWDMFTVTSYKLQNLYVPVGTGTYKIPAEVAWDILSLPTTLLSSLSPLFSITITVTIDTILSLQCKHCSIWSLPQKLPPRSDRDQKKKCFQIQGHRNWFQFSSLYFHFNYSHLEPVTIWNCQRILIQYSYETFHNLRWQRGHKLEDS